MYNIIKRRLTSSSRNNDASSFAEEEEEEQAEVVGSIDGPMRLWDVLFIDL